MINKTVSKFSIFYCSFSELLLQKIKILLLLAVFTSSSFNVFAQNSSLISNCSDFVAGSNSAWPYVLVATTIADGSVSQGAQTFTMNVTDTASGTNIRVAKTTANGNWFFGPAVALTLGSNSITVAAVTFDRTVKFQFSSGDAEFDALILNGDTSNCVIPPPPPPPSTSSLISTCSDFVAGSNPAWPYVLVATTIADGSVSQGAQTFTMNVTSLPTSGANVRVYKTTANGNDFFGNPVALTLGINSITVSAVAFDRAVKFQFSSGDVEFDALSLNGVDSDCIANITALDEYDDVYLNTFPNPSYGDLFIKSNDPIEFLEIKDFSGRVVLEMTPQKSNAHIQTSQLKKSLYFLRCLINKKWITRKIILN